MSEERITVADGKYTVINDNGNLSALRHGEPWARDLVGDNLVYWMFVRIRELEAIAQQAQEPVGEIMRSFSDCSGLKVHLYGNLTSDTPGIVGTKLYTTPQPQPAPLATPKATLMTEHRDYIDGYTAGLADGRRIAPQPAVPVVSDEQIRKTVESIQDPDTVHAFHNGYYTLTPNELRRTILALHTATQPCGHPASLVVRSAESGEALYCEACDDKSGRREAELLEAELLEANQKLRDEILALRPAVEPMTREQIWHSNGIMSVNAELGWHMDDIVRVARAVEAHHGITAKAEGGA